MQYFLIILIILGSKLPSPSVYSSALLIVSIMTTLKCQCYQENTGTKQQPTFEISIL